MATRELCRFFSTRSTLLKRGNNRSTVTVCTPCSRPCSSRGLGSACSFLSRFNGIHKANNNNLSVASFVTTSQARNKPLNNDKDSRAISSDFVEVNGVKIHYQTTGSGNHTLLLLPGALGSTMTDFSPQIKNLNKDLFTVVAWDPRGYGLSRPPDRSWPEHFLERDALDAAKMMQNLGFKKYSLLGWSDGGITALILAAHYPDAVRKLVVWGSNSYVTPEEIESYQKIRDIDAWSPRMRQPFVDLYGEEYFRSQWGQWVDAFSSYLKNKSGNICSDELSKIQCPTLIVHGQKDPLVPQFHPDYLNEHIKQSKLHTMPEGKHNLHLKYYKEFNSLVENFLTSQWTNDILK